MKIDIIAGARPNFMKIAPIIDAIRLKQKSKTDIQYRLVHTGQHYDRNMSGDFLDVLGIPQPDVNLEVGSGTQAEQTAHIMMGYEKLLLKQTTDICLVVGDVTSTMACSIVAKKMSARVAHVEGGIRSFDWTMPEEINRIVTDAVTDFFFTTSGVANENLRKAGVPDERIFFVGNTMIDTLLKNMPRLTPPDFWNSLSLREKEYFVLTLHRPSNVDEPSQLKNLLNEISKTTRNLPIVFPVHPRSAKALSQTGHDWPNLKCVSPLGYLEFNYLVKNSKAVITDSGGVTEEATVMGIPCMTLRNSTERPETVTIGTNELLGTHPDAIGPAMVKLFNGIWKKGAIPEKWDGHAGTRIVEILTSLR